MDLLKRFDIRAEIASLTVRLKVHDPRPGSRFLHSEILPTSLPIGFSVPKLPKRQLASDVTMNPCLPAGLYEGAKNTDEYLDQLTLARILLKNPKISTQEAQDMVINMKQGKRAPGAVHDGLSEEVIFTSKSALPKVDLHVSPLCEHITPSLISLLFLQKVFQNPQAWNVLSEAEKADLQRDLGPEAFEPDGTISQEFLKHNAHWAGSIRQFSTDVEAGRYEQRFAEEASAAMEARASGAFDTYKEAQVEEFYGQKQKVDRNVLAGDAASVSLSDIIKDNVFAIGDIWSYERAFGRGTMAYVVGKECIVGYSAFKLTMC